MNDPVVHLIRRFLPISSQLGAMDWFSDIPIGLPARWPELETLHRVLILADPGAGKTFEARSHATKMRDRGLKAFFIRIEAIDGEFPDAFEVGNAGDFDAWLENSEDAWFFLDSVDEAQLETPRALETAIKLFGERIYHARERAHIYITSREDAWQALPDRTLITQHLPYGAPLERPAEGDNKDKQDTALSVFRLAPLNKNEIQLFAGYYSVTDPVELLAAIERSNLWSLAERPFDLRALIGKWKADRSLGGREDLLRRLAKLQIDALDAPNGRQLLRSGRALAAIKALATAVTMTGRNRLGLVGTTVGEDRLDPKGFLPDWEPDDIAGLLRTGIFDDIVYGSVRFRHRDMRELLTAEYFQERLARESDRSEIEALFFRNVYGEEVIVPRLRPVLVWLILFDDKVRDRALSLEPEIATEGGDPSKLPLAIRQNIIRNMVDRLAAKYVTGSIIDNVAISRVAQSDIESDVADLIDRHIADDDVIFFLGRLVWQAQMTTCIPSLLSIASDPARGIYARIASARAVMTAGSTAQRVALWNALITERDPVERRLFAEVVSEAANDTETVQLILKVLECLEPYERFQGSGLGSALHRYIERLPMMADAAPSQPLKTLVVGISGLLDREPYVERGECDVAEQFVWLSAHGIHAVERLATSRSVAALEPAALSLMIKFPSLRYWRQGDAPEYKTKLSETVPRWIDLNDALYWRSIDDGRRRAASSDERVTSDRRIAFVGHFWGFGPDAFGRVLAWIGSKTHPDDQLVALSRAITIYLENGRPVEWLDRLYAAVTHDTELREVLEEHINPKPTEQALKWEAEHVRWEEEQRDREARRDADYAMWVARMKKDPDQVRHPTNLEPGQFSSDQYHLMASVKGDELTTSRSQGANWEGLITEFGEEVALAYRDAAVAHWRLFRPELRSEGDNRSSVPYSLIFGMAGLQIEFDENAELFERLSGEEVELVLRYALYELNGYPGWLEHLFKVHPESARAFFWTEMQWELGNSKTDQPMHYIVHDVVYHAPWLHAIMAPLLLQWLEYNEVPSDDLQRYILSILSGGEITDRQFEDLAIRKLESEATPASHRPVWYATFVGVRAENGIAALEAELATLAAADASDFAQSFVVALLGGRRGSGLSGKNFRTPHHLKRLYVLMHRYIRAADDIERAGKGVYSPTRRDDAQDARNRLFSMLSDEPGEATYRAIKALEDEHPEEDYRRWMRLRAHERAVADADQSVWTLDKAIAFLK